MKTLHVWLKVCLHPQSLIGFKRHNIVQEKLLQYFCKNNSSDIPYIHIYGGYPPLIGEKKTVVEFGFQVFPKANGLMTKLYKFLTISPKIKLLQPLKQPIDSNWLG